MIPFHPHLLDLTHLIEEVSEEFVNLLTRK
jgi:hypothetical protein